MDFLSSLKWNEIAETFIADFSVALIMALVGAFFLNLYITKINFSKHLNDLGFENASLRKQSHSEINEMFSSAVCIKMIFVSGTHFLKENEANIKGALKRGARVEVLVARPDSSLVDDIEHMENKHFINGKRLRERDNHIDTEILEIIDIFKDSNLDLRFYNTEYRLPFKLAYYQDGTVKAWLTMSLPPYKSVQSFVLRGKKDVVEESEGLHFVEMMEVHFDAIFENAKSSEEVLNDYYAYKTYKELENKAHENMKEALNYEGALIEVAAQHPLKDKTLPNDEFKARLDRAYDLYHELKQRHEHVKIYVPGDAHFDDKLSLSKAGCRYLLEKGIASDDLYGEEMNVKYAKEGVYNSTDECMVAAKIFFDEHMQKLYCVCSSAQLERKALSYIRFGALADFIVVTLDKMYHSYVDEAFYKIPAMLKESSYQKEMAKTHAQRDQRNRP